MKYDQTPHPLVEDHYHVRHLIEKQEKRSSERTEWQERKKQEDAFAKELAGYKDIELLDYWCDHCRVDFVARAHKQIDSWDNIAYYKMKHRCGTWCIRRITDRQSDAYFFRSRKVAYDRGNATLDMLQPFQTGFNLMYGKK